VSSFAKRIICVFFAKIRVAASR